MPDILHVCQDAEALAASARDWLVRLAQQHFATSQHLFSIALSGGSTPKRLYELLVELPPGTIDWQRVLLLWGDERNVPLDHPDSNYRMVKESLLDHIPIPANHVLNVPRAGSSALEVAAGYEQLLRDRLPSFSGMPAVIDCVLLGIGDDVHTASLFPETHALKERGRWVVANFVPKLDSWRITMTAPLINAGRNVAFLISGSGKREALFKLWHAPLDPDQLPAQLVRPTHGQLQFFVDRAALSGTSVPETIAMAS
jgi:6-phosphogluconolactonase